ncbi:MAG: hypothetical protein WD335_03355 [Candidatus Paceibacterota bacterium]
MLYFLMGIIVGVGGALIYLQVNGASEDASLIQRSQTEKKDNIERLVAYLDDHDTITNDDVEALLDLSHATATRYLDALEAEDLIEQIGTSGRSVHYEVK